MPPPKSIHRVGDGNQMHLRCKENKVGAGPQHSAPLRPSRATEEVSRKTPRPVLTLIKCSRRSKTPTFRGRLHVEVKSTGQVRFAILLHGAFVRTQTCCSIVLVVQVFATFNRSLLLDRFQ